MSRTKGKRKLSSAQQLSDNGGSIRRRGALGGKLPKVNPNLTKK